MLGLGDIQMVALSASPLTEPVGGPHLHPGPQCQNCQVRISEDTQDPQLCGFHGVKTGLMSRQAIMQQGGNPMACRTPAMDLCCNCAWKLVLRHTDGRAESKRPTCPHCRARWVDDTCMETLCESCFKYGF